MLAPPMLEPCAEGVWTVVRPLRFLGLEIGTRMTVLRLRGGGLFVHSPVALDETLREAVDALGTVTAIVAPNLFHHLYVAEWARAYPSASVSACPGLQGKRSDVTFGRVLGDEAPAEWQDSLQQVVFGAIPMLSEVVFFHPDTKTLISSDLVMNLASHGSALTRAAAFCMGNTAPGPTLLERLLVRDRKAARAQLDRMLAWEPERIVLAHGDMVAADGAKVLQQGYRWL